MSDGLQKKSPVTVVCDSGMARPAGSHSHLSSPHGWEMGGMCAGGWGEGKGLGAQPKIIQGRTAERLCS